MTVCFETTGVAISVDDCCEGPRGGDEEGFEREGEVAEEWPAALEDVGTCETTC